jgi:zinc transport system permease protein
MWNLLSHAFVQRAWLGGLAIGAACGVLGMLLYLRRSVLVGEGLGHFSFGAVGLALLLGWPPLAVALPLSVLASLLVLKLARATHGAGDAAVGMVATVGLALGVLLASIGGGYRIDIFAYLFGDILAIQTGEVWAAWAVAALVTVMVFRQPMDWLAWAFDPGHAQATGRPIERLDKLLAVLTAVTVVLGLRLVGSLLVASLLVFPPATALWITTAFRRAIVTSAVVAMAAVTLGLGVSLWTDVPTSAAIVLAQAALHVGTWFVRRMR